MPQIFGRCFGVTRGGVRIYLSNRPIIVTLASTPGDSRSTVLSVLSHVDSEHLFFELDILNVMDMMCLFFILDIYRVKNWISMDIYGYFDGVDLDMFDEFDGYLWICLLLFFFKL